MFDPPQLHKIDPQSKFWYTSCTNHGKLVDGAIFNGDVPRAHARLYAQIISGYVPKFHDYRGANDICNCRFCDEGPFKSTQMIEHVIWDCASFIGSRRLLSKDDLARGPTYVVNSEPFMTQFVPAVVDALEAEV